MIPYMITNTISILELVWVAITSFGLIFSLISFGIANANFRLLKQVPDYVEFGPRYYIAINHLLSEGMRSIVQACLLTVGALAMTVPSVPHHMGLVELGSIILLIASASILATNSLSAFLLRRQTIESSKKLGILSKSDSPPVKTRDQS